MGLTINPVGTPDPPFATETVNAVQGHAALHADHADVLRSDTEQHLSSAPAAGSSRRPESF